MADVAVSIARNVSDDEGWEFCENLYNTLINESAKFLCEKITEFNENSLKDARMGAVDPYMLYILSEYIPADIEDTVTIDILNSIAFDGYDPYVLTEKDEKNSLHQSILVETFDGVIPSYGDPESELICIDSSEDDYNLLGEYSGEYLNIGGKMIMTMYINNAIYEGNNRVQVSAVIAFKPYDRTSAAKSGTYFASGYVDIKAGTIIIEPDKWISEQPKGYEMLGFKGFYEEGEIDALLDRDELRELTFKKE